MAAAHSLLSLLCLTVQLLILCTQVPHTGALNVKTLGQSFKSSTIPITGNSLGADPAKSVKSSSKGLASKLKYVKTPLPAPATAKVATGTKPQADEWHIEAWERSKRKTQHIASLVSRRASEYSAWLRSNNIDPETTSTTELQKEFSAHRKEVVSTIQPGDSPLSSWCLSLAWGSTASPQYLALDFSSGWTWIQCVPCDSCYGDSDSIYDPSTSNTYSTVACDNRICTSYSGAVNFSCSATAADGSSVCGYSTSYLEDGSTSSGTVALDTWTAEAPDGGDALTVSDFVHGCGHNNVGSYSYAQTGVAGLDRSELAIATQVATSQGYSFAQSVAYCIPPRGSEGFFIFGGTSGYFGSYDFVNSPIVTNPSYPDLYYINLTGLKVSGSDAALDSSELQLNSDGTGGTALAGWGGLWLNENSYDALIAILKDQTQNLEPADEGDSQDVQSATKLGLCYYVKPDETYVGIPNLTLTFASSDGSDTGIDIDLAKDGYFTAVNDDRSVFCYSIYKTETGTTNFISPTIFTNWIVEHDTDTNEYAFAANEGCALTADSGGGEAGNGEGPEEGEGQGEGAGGEGGEGGQEGEGGGQEGEGGGEGGDEEGGDGGDEEGGDGGDGEGGEGGDEEGGEGGDEEGGEGGDDEGGEGGDEEGGEGGDEEGGEGGDEEGGEGGDEDGGDK